MGAALVIISFVLGGCDRLRHKSPAAAKAETKRQQAACASPAANDRLKNAIFDEAIARRSIDRSKLDTLADYSVARMENPVVKGWDQSLDITRCEGRFILEVPPGAERGLGGARQLQADIDYTAQRSADGAGLVYKQKGADAMVATLAQFNLGPVAYRPPPAIDQDAAESSAAQQVSVPETRLPPLPNPPQELPARTSTERSDEARAQKTAPHPSIAKREPPPGMGKTDDHEQVRGGEGVVRAFYAAVGAGNGAAAASQVIPQKRSSGPFSAGAISRFYGRLPEPLRLTSVTPEGGAYRVTYRYSAGRSRCNGVAIVRVTNRDGRNLISSIRSLSGC